MASQSMGRFGRRRMVTRALASGTLAAGLLIGAGVSTAHADVLDDISAEYDTGAGGGQISNLIHSAMRLRAAGFVPSKGNMADLQAGWDERPNQAPLVVALENTVAYMKRSQARAATRGPAVNPPTIGGLNPGTAPNPNAGGGISVPITP